MEQCHFSSAVLMCHAPIVIPEIAEGRADICANSTNAMQQAAQFLLSQKNDLTVVLSPHTQRFRTHYSMIPGEKLNGDFGDFGRKELQLQFRSDVNLQNSIEDLAKNYNFPLKKLSAETRLDHGALVPLYFLAKSGYDGKVLVIGFSYETSTQLNHNLGVLLQEFAKAHPHLKIGILASGDMSHRLIPGAPAGFHPQAARFDRLVVKCVETGELSHISAIHSELRELAAEDVVDSLEITAAALNTHQVCKKLLSYEGPFGVGYLVSILYDKSKEICNAN